MKSPSDLVTAMTEYASYSDSNSTFEEYYDDNFVSNNSQSDDRPMNKFPRTSQTKVMTPKGMDRNSDSDLLSELKTFDFRFLNYNIEKPSQERMLLIAKKSNKR